MEAMSLFFSRGDALTADRAVEGHYSTRTSTVQYSYSTVLHGARMYPLKLYINLIFEKVLESSEHVFELIRYNFLAKVNAAPPYPAGTATFCLYCAQTILRKLLKVGREPACAAAQAASAPCKRRRHEYAATAIADTTCTATA